MGEAAAGLVLVTKSALMLATIVATAVTAFVGTVRDGVMAEGPSGREPLRAVCVEESDPRGPIEGAERKGGPIRGVLVDEVETWGSDRGDRFNGAEDQNDRSAGTPPRNLIRGCRSKESDMNELV